MSRYNNLIRSLVEIKEKETLTEIERQLEKYAEPLALIEALREGINLIGERFEKGEYFLSELIMGGKIFKDAMKLLEPHLKSTQEIKPLGKVVIGTVQGDIHDIGKNIVATLLTSLGFTVEDLGVDVAAERFVSKVKEIDGDIVGLSALLTIAFDAMKETVARLRQNFSPQRPKIVIGGGPVDKRVLEYVGADALAGDATEAAKICQKFMGIY